MVEESPPPADHPSNGDALYQPIKPFEQFGVTWVPDEPATKAATARADSLKAASPNAATLIAAIKVLARTAAAQTGAIESLYEISPGETLNFALDPTSWTEAVSARRDVNAAEYLAVQDAVYEQLVVESRPDKSMSISQAQIRDLHKQVTAAQDTYTVQTPIGRREQTLEKGEYKKTPNHVVTRSGLVHAYCPAFDTQAEMGNLVDYLNGESFLAANPIRQATYAHWALTHIHPFADGNGRVARALASLYLLRAFDVPLLLFADRKEEYFSCLERADEGDSSVLMTHFEHRTVDAIQWLSEVLEHQSGVTLSRVRGRLQALRRALAGEAMEGYDDLGLRVLNYLRNRFTEVANSELDENIKWRLFGARMYLFEAPKPYRFIKLHRLRNERPVEVDDLTLNEGGLQLRLRLTEPMELEETIALAVVVPEVPSAAFAVRVDVQGAEPILLRADSLSPDLSAAAILRLDMAVGRAVRDALDRLGSAAEDALKTQGRLPLTWTSD